MRAPRLRDVKRRVDVEERLLLGVGHAGGERPCETCGRDLSSCGHVVEEWDDEMDGTTETTTRSFDPDRLGIGSSWLEGDFASDRIVVPSAPTADPSHRYLLRLLGIRVEEGQILWLRGMRFGAIIGALVPGVGGGLYPLDMLVESPFWSFPDGNVDFIPRWIAGNVEQLAPQATQGVPDLLTPPNYSVDYYGQAPSLLFALGAPTLLFPNGLPQDGIHAPYVPPAGGEPPGVPLDGIVDVRDGRLEWPGHGVEEDLGIMLPGPGMLGVYASVRQTDPRTRVVLPAQFAAVAPNEEDRFVSQMDALSASVRYRYVSAAVTADVGPIRNVPRKRRICRP